MKLLKKLWENLVNLAKDARGPLRDALLIGIQSIDLLEPRGRELIIKKGPDAMVDIINLIQEKMKAIVYKVLGEPKSDVPPVPAA